MKKPTRHIILVLCIAGSSIYFHVQDLSGREKASQAVAVKEQNPSKKEKTRELDVHTNFLFNEIVTGGAFRIKTTKDRFLDEKNPGWSDYCTISYDYTSLNSAYGDLLRKERRNKEKKLWILGYHVSYKQKPFVDLMYSSDGSVGIYTTFLSGGLGKKFSNGLKIEGGMGVKTGNLNYQKEKYNVVNLSVGFKTPNKKSDYRIDAQVKAFLPRKYLTNNSFEGLWMVDAKASVAINKKIFGVMPAVGLNFRRDYIPVIENKILSHEGIVRYNLTLGFKIAKGGAVKKK